MDINYLAKSSYLMQGSHCPREVTAVKQPVGMPKFREHCAKEQNVLLSTCRHAGLTTPNLAGIFLSDLFVKNEGFV